MQSKFSPQML